MGYIPKFIHLDRFIVIRYPFGVYWKDEYIKQSARAIYNTYKNDIYNGYTITFIARGTSGAMIAGAILNELKHIESSTEVCILIVRKDGDDAHSSSLQGIDEIRLSKIIVIDDFIESGDTINAILERLDSRLNSIFPKYDMLCVSNYIDASRLKKNKNDDYRRWKEICSRFEYVVCCPKPD